MNKLFYRKAIGTLHWPVTNFWNKETVLLEVLSLREKPVQILSEELTADERLQVITKLMKTCKILINVFFLNIDKNIIFIAY